MAGDPILARTRPLRVAVLVALLAAAVSVAVAVALDRPEGARSVEAYPTIAATTSRPEAVVVGGSLAGGQGASDVDTAWPYLISSSRDWSTVLMTGDGFDVFGAGSDCDDCGDWRSVLQSTLAADPDVVVIVGQVEEGADPRSVATASTSLIAGLGEASGDRAVVVVAPPAGDAGARERLTSALAQAAKSSGAVFVPTADGALPTGSVDADGASLTDDGQAALARLIGRALTS